MNFDVNDTQLDDADIWFNNRDKNIADYEVPEFQEDQELDIDNEPEKITATEVRTELNMIKLSEPTAEIIVELINILFPILLTYILKGTEKDLIKLDDGEKETLVRAFANYLKDKNIQSSPGVILLTTIITIYGSKIMVAYILKNEKENEIDQIKEQNAQLREQNEMIRQMIDEQKNGKKK